MTESREYILYILFYPGLTILRNITFTEFIFIIIFILNSLFTDFYTTLLSAAGTRRSIEKFKGNRAKI